MYINANSLYVMHRSEQAAACQSWIFMALSMLRTAGVRWD